MSRIRCRGKQISIKRPYFSLGGAMFGLTFLFQFGFVNSFMQNKPRPLREREKASPECPLPTAFIPTFPKTIVLFIYFCYRLISNINIVRKKEFLRQ